MSDIKIVTIDGPAGAGKSTIAKLLAKELGFSYLDTGAMYRALTLKAINSRADLEDEDELVDIAKNTKIDFEDGKAGLRVFLDGNDVSDAIRTVEVTNNTFYIARAPRVREIMVELQREIGSRKSVVVEGRDTGTVVFPNATNKFYLDADVNERSKRRHKELVVKGKEIDEGTVMADLKDRDNKDFTREVGPLKKADDAVVIDSTPLSIEEVAAEILKYVNK